MKKKLQNLIFLLVSIISINVHAQNLITPITISLPTNPPANTADWATTMPPVMVTAQTRMQNGQINSAVIESRILVTIKSAGGKVCGTYTAQNAPMSGFSSATKVWSGANVVSLLGQDCILKAGSYELCVQFYGLTPAQAGLIGEACKAFTIKDNSAESYSPPTNISPTKDKILTEKEAKAPLTFRWTPVLPKPREAVTYRLKVWQLMQGQNGIAAMKANRPVVEKDLKDITQFVKPNLMGDLEMLGNKEAQLVWNVEAISATQAGEKSLGSSEPSGLSINNSDCNVSLKIDSVQCTKRKDPLGNPIFIAFMKLTNIGANSLNLNNTINITTNPFAIINTYIPKYVIATNAIAYTTPLTIPSIITTGSPVLFSTEVSMPSSATKLITRFTLYDNISIASCNPIDSIVLPLCICNDCKFANVNITNQTVSLTNPTAGIYSASGSLSITGITPIYAVEIQVQSYSFTATPASCSNGITSVESSGVINLAGTTINGSAVTMVNETVSGLPSTNNGVAKNIKLTSTSPLPSSMPFNINFGLPVALTGLNSDCCKLKHNICLKIRVYYDKEKCNSCSFTYCFPEFTN